MRKIDLAGSKFGRLTVQNEEGRANGEVCWRCRCDCGKDVVVRSHFLRTGHTKSCGCLFTEMVVARNKKMIKKNKLPEGESAMNHLIQRYSRRHTWCLSKEEACALFLSDCYYCDIAPAQVSHGSGRASPFVYNGLDRVDNAAGYESGNVVACCKICNVAKNSLSVDEFKTWLRRVCAKTLQVSL